MDLAGTSIFTAAVTVGIAGIIAFGLYKLFSVKGELQTNIDYGRQWTAWIVAITTLTNIPKFIRTFDENILILWIISVVAFGTIAFISGWLYSKFLGKENVITNSENSNSALTAKSTKSSSEQPLIKPQRESAMNKTPLSNTIESDDDEQHYLQAWNEIKDEQVNEALWAKSFSECEGDSDKTKAKYIGHRVNDLINETNINNNHFEKEKDKYNKINTDRELTHLAVNDEEDETNIALNDDGFDENGYTPLMNAVNNQDSKTVELLIEQGADPYNKDYDSNITAFNIANTILKEAKTLDTEKVALDIISLLYRTKEIILKDLREYDKDGLDKDGFDIDGHTPIMKAVINMEYKTLAKLLNMGGNRNVKDKFTKSKTALDLARDKLKDVKLPYREKQFQEIIKLLEQC